MSGPLDLAWLRQMMIDEAVQIVAETMAKDRHPRAEWIVAEARRVLHRTNLRPGAEDLCRRAQDEDMARAIWREMVGREILCQIADLRPN